MRILVADDDQLSRLLLQSAVERLGFASPWSQPTATRPGSCSWRPAPLRNREILEGDLAAIHARSERYGRPYYLAMCDVDLFKA